MPPPSARSSASSILGSRPPGSSRRLHNTGRPVATNGTPQAVGGGYIDAAAALASVKPIPAAPSVTSAVSGNGRATVSWTAARTNPAFPVTGYQVTPLLGGVAQPSTVFNSAATSEVVTGLTNGATYTFKVAAFNVNGLGPTSAAGGTTKIGAPGIPTAVTATPGNAQAVVKWTAPASNGLTITGYTVTPFVGAVAQAPRVFNSAATTANRHRPHQRHRRHVQGHGAHRVHERPRVEGEWAHRRRRAHRAHRGHGDGRSRPSDRALDGAGREQRRRDHRLRRDTVRRQRRAGTANLPIDGDDPDDHRPHPENRILVPRCRGEQPRHRSELHGVERRQRDLNGCGIGQ